MIRRNKDGQQNLADLRKTLEASPHNVYKLGGNWIMQKWSQDHNAYLEQPAPWWMGERQAIQKVLFGSFEREDEVRYHARRKACSN